MHIGTPYALQAAVAQGSRGTGQPWHRAVVAQGSRGTGQPWHRAAVAQGSRGICKRHAVLATSS